MRYCGECGSSLGTDALYTRGCPKCGASIESDSSAAGLVDSELLNNPTRVIRGHLLAGAPQENGGHLSRQRLLPPRRVLWTLGLAVAALVLIAGGTALTLSHLRNGADTHVTSTGSRISDSGSSSERTPGSADTGPGGLPATANPSQTAAATQSPVVGGSPTAGATIGATPGGTVSTGPVPTSTPTPPILSVSPTNFPGLLCVNLAPQKFTIYNNGGSLMEWSASWTVGYSVSQSSGSIVAGGSQQVSVSSILLSGTVTITAPGAENSPVQVHFNCLA